jgi:LPS sulfotransferase NodH
MQRLIVQRMSHYHLLPWLISRGWNVTKHATQAYEFAARAIQIGLCKIQPTRSGGEDHRLKTGAAKRASAQPSRVREVKRDDQVRPKNKASGLRRASLYQGKGFMITCPARSGSSMLVNLLRSHPEICSHDEVFSPQKVTGIIGKYLERIKENPDYVDELSGQRYSDPIWFLYAVVLDPQGKKSVGFKLKHDELVLPGYKMLRHEIAENRDLRIIHLRRNNLLRRYLSHYLAMHVTRVTFAVGAMPIPEVARIRLDPRECEKNFETILAREAEFAGLFAQHRGFHISYEDFVNGQSRKLNALLEFLGVPPRQLTTTTRKLGRDDLRQAIANFDELREYFSGTRFAEFFEAE